MTKTMLNRIADFSELLTLIFSCPLHSYVSAKPLISSEAFLFKLEHQLSVLFL